MGRSGLLGDRSGIETSFHCLISLVLFPLLIQRPLIIGKQGIDLPVSALHDSPADAGFCATVTRGVIPKAIHGDIAVDEDYLELEDLILAQMELFFQVVQLAGGLPGRGGFALFGLWQGGVGGLGMGQYERRDPDAGQQDKSHHL